MTAAPPQPPVETLEFESVVEAPRRMSIEQLVRGYFWFIFKNVVGWLAIIASPLLGVLLPGPGGIPLFIVGFALVTFPGKRKLTTHVFRGRRLPIESPAFTGLITFFSVLVTAGVMWAAWRYYTWIVEQVPILGRYAGGDVGKLVGIGILALPVTMLVSWVGLKLLNYILLNWVPGIRRFLRRTLRKYGVRLLPTRRRRIGGETEFVGDEIIGLDEPQRRKLLRAWATWSPWLNRLLAVSLTVAVLFFIISPVVNEWEAVETRIGRIDIVRVTLGITAFAAGLALFRAGTWWSILKGFGRPIPSKAAVRIWALGHLARFIPGQSYVVLRMELTRPYGASGTQANVSQRLESTLLMMAALGLGATAFWWKAWEQLPGLKPLWLVLAIVSPVLLLLLVPGVFYRLVPQQVGRTAGPYLGETRLRGGRLLGLALWQLGGLLWQSLAVWLLVGGPLSAEGAWLAIAGAWALGWAAGHLARWSPGGIGVREIVFVACLSVLLPQSLREEMRQIFSTSSFLEFGGWARIGPRDLLQPTAWQDVWWAFLFFLSLLLRLATTAAEVLFATIATAVDWQAVRAFIQGHSGTTRYAPQADDVI